MYRTGIADRHSAMEYKHERDENAFLFVCLFICLFFLGVYRRLPEL